LIFGFSDRSEFRVISRAQEPDDDLDNWDLFTPEGLVLIWGPDANWRLQGAHASR
jgi:hypothetical protein